MIESDRTEILARGRMKDIIETYQIHPDLFGIPKEASEGLIIIRDDGVHAITEEIYELMVDLLNAKPK